MKPRAQCPPSVFIPRAFEVSNGLLRAAGGVGAGSAVGCRLPKPETRPKFRSTAAFGFMETEGRLEGSSASDNALFLPLSESEGSIGFIGLRV